MKEDYGISEVAEQNKHKVVTPIREVASNSTVHFLGT